MLTGAISKSFLIKNSPTLADSVENREPSNPILTKLVLLAKLVKTWGALNIKAANDTSPSVDRTSWNVSFTYISEQNNAESYCTPSEFHSLHFQLQGKWALIVISKLILTNAS